MATIADVVSQLENVGIFEFFLPFVIIFAVVYGMLHKTKIFGDPAKDPIATKINAIVAFAFGLFIMVYPTTSIAVFSLTDIIATMVGDFLLYIFVIIIFMIIMFMIATPLGGGETKPISKPLTVGAIAAILLVVALYLSSGGTQILPGMTLGPGTGFGGFGWNVGFIDPSVIALGVLLILMAAGVWWVTKSS